MNVTTRLEFELVYNDSAVHRFNIYTTRRPAPQIAEFRPIIYMDIAIIYLLLRFYRYQLEKQNLCIQPNSHSFKNPAKQWCKHELVDCPTSLPAAPQVYRLTAFLICFALITDPTPPTPQPACDVWNFKTPHVITPPTLIFSPLFHFNSFLTHHNVYYFETLAFSGTPRSFVTTPHF